MSTQHFHLPDVGEGLTEAEVVKWLVAVGETVEQNQVLVEIETAKSLVELPSPFEGTVTDLLVEEGQTVEVGAALIAIASATADSGPPPTASPEPASAHESAARPTDTGGPEPRPSVLVGYGPSETDAVRRRRRAPALNGAAPVGDPGPGPRVATDVRAKPPVRKLAKDLGIDLSAVVGTGARGIVTRDDVLRHVHRVPDEAPVVSRSAGIQPVGDGAAPTDPSSTRIPVKGVRKATAAAMSASAFTAPHVTEFLTVDLTRSVRLVEKLRVDPTFEGSRVTILLLVARALLAAIRQYPDINASWDEDAAEIVRYHQVNLGIAAATPRGLMVPNIKNAGALSLRELADALGGLVATARAGRSTPEDMSRGTITITNIGVFGVDAGTPILNPGEAAILCVGAVRQTPWAHRGKVALRWTTQLALSFDHRLVDGELGSKVLARVGRILDNPRWELLLT